ncbi:MAG: hypothetical protein FWF02_11745, partial [Micrococcales bacterium]|nr:hypothetical protein [Micrococcales bacterium]
VSAAAVAMVAGVTVAAVALGPSSVSETPGPSTSSAEPVCPGSGVLATGPATVTGTVTYPGGAASGGELTFHQYYEEPIDFDEVSAESWDGYGPVHVSDTGRYEIELPAGVYTVKYHPMGYDEERSMTAAADYQSFVALEVLVIKGQNSIDFEIESTDMMVGYAGARTGTLCGSVTNPGKEIVGGGELSFEVIWPVPDGPESLVTTAPLSDTGQYAVELPAGVYVITFLPAGHGEPDFLRRPGRDEGIATVVGGRNQVANFYTREWSAPESEPGSTATVSGTVTYHGAVATDCDNLDFWYVDPRNGYYRGPVQVPVSSDGAFTVDLVAGEYHVWRAEEIIDTITVVASQPMVLAIELDPLTLTVLSG